MSYSSKHSEAFAGFKNRTITLREAHLILMDLGYSNAVASTIVVDWLRERDNIPPHVSIVLNFEEPECA